MFELISYVKNYLFIMNFNNNIIYIFKIKTYFVHAKILV